MNSSNASGVPMGFGGYSTAPLQRTTATSLATTVLRKTPTRSARRVTRTRLWGSQTTALAMGLGCLRLAPGRWPSTPRRRNSSSNSRRTSSKTTQATWEARESTGGRRGRVDACQKQASAFCSECRLQNEASCSLCRIALLAFKSAGSGGRRGCTGSPPRFARSRSVRSRPGWKSSTYSADPHARSVGQTLAASWAARQARSPLSGE
jgi:hypothetical protein